MIYPVDKETPSKRSHGVPGAFCGCERETLKKINTGRKLALGEQTTGFLHGESTWGSVPLQCCPRSHPCPTAGSLTPTSLPAERAATSPRESSGRLSRDAGETGGRQQPLTRGWKRGTQAAGPRGGPVGRQNGASQGGPPGPLTSQRLLELQPLAGTEGDGAAAPRPQPRDRRGAQEVSAEQHGGHQRQQHRAQPQARGPRRHPPPPPPAPARHPRRTWGRRCRPPRWGTDGRSRTPIVTHLPERVANGRVEPAPHRECSREL